MGYHEEDCLLQRHLANLRFQNCRQRHCWKPPPRAFRARAGYPRGNLPAPALRAVASAQYRKEMEQRPGPVCKCYKLSIGLDSTAKGSVSAVVRRLECLRYRLARLRVRRNECQYSFSVVGSDQC